MQVLVIKKKQQNTYKEIKLIPCVGVCIVSIFQLKKITNTPYNSRNNWKSNHHEWLQADLECVLFGLYPV